MSRNIEELRAAAARALPRAVMGFIEGGAEDETTVRGNREAFGALQLVPRVFVDVSARDLSTVVAGTSMAAPIIAAPAGLLGLVHPDGELAGVVAAGRLGLTSVVSPMSTRPLEEIVAAAPIPPWANVFPFGDRGALREFAQRARDAGCGGLVYSADVAVPGNRERDKRNGVIAPPKLTSRNLADAVLHPRWTANLLRYRRVTLQNFDPGTPPLRGFMAAASRSTSRTMRTLNPAMTWSDLEFLRDCWDGILAVKGPVRATDAVEMQKRGVNVIIVSNHGGRQLDHVRPSLEQLPAVVDAVGNDVDIVVDGGIRRGTDIAKALALGAKACMVGRAWVYGLAAGGTVGAQEGLTCLIRELDNVMALIGANNPTELDRSFVRYKGQLDS